MKAFGSGHGAVFCVKSLQWPQSPQHVFVWASPTTGRFSFQSGSGMRPERPWPSSTWPGPRYHGAPSQPSSEGTDLWRSQSNMQTQQPHAPVAELVGLAGGKLLRHRLLDLGVRHAVKHARLDLVQHLPQIQLISLELSTSLFTDVEGSMTPVYWSTDIAAPNFLQAGRQLHPADCQGPCAGQLGRLPAEGTIAEGRDRGKLSRRTFQRSLGKGSCSAVWMVRCRVDVHTDTGIVLPCDVCRLHNKVSVKG